VPWRLIISRPEFARATYGIRPPGGVYCHVSGCDIVRDADGSWKVLEATSARPADLLHARAHKAMTRLLPGLFACYRVRPVDHYPLLLLTALREVAARRGRRADRRGVDARAAERRLLRARDPRAADGVELVEASDLVVRDELCFIRRTSGLERVHAIYRRLDDQFIDHDPPRQRPWRLAAALEG
jgi:uncharacterized circularly permuted ATP-grasp superfamily protein